MFKRLFGAAFAAGIVAGLAISAIQEFTTTPIILHAEEYENAGEEQAAVQDAAVFRVAGTGAFPGFTLYKAHSDEAHGDEEAWGPEDGLERSLYSAGTNIVMGVAFALMLTAAFAVHGGAMNGRTGLLWGIGGFTVFTLGPNLGLPPEVPGSMAAELGARQIWWIGCAIATGIGLALAVFGRKLPFVILGILLMAAPHIVGAPQPAAVGGGVPPEIAGHFAAASIVVAAIFWAMLGWLSGTFYQRFSGASA
ncbi:MAG: CbtA family protein [Alphaproteobacteria bacterium]|nr:CbtA family protein [Alphaproteobacteria bacterium]